MKKNYIQLIGIFYICLLIAVIHFPLKVAYANQCVDEGFAVGSPGYRKCMSFTGTQNRYNYDNNEASSYSGDEKYVSINDRAPGEGYEEIAQISARDGLSRKCGAFTNRFRKTPQPGTYEKALDNLKKQARIYDADYVQITQRIPPKWVSPNCFNSTYQLYGTAFKKIDGYQKKEARNMVNSKRTPADKLRELKKLQDEGVITEKEFNQQKKKILNEAY